MEVGFLRLTSEFQLGTEIFRISLIFSLGLGVNLFGRGRLFWFYKISRKKYFFRVSISYLVLFCIQKNTTHYKALQAFIQNIFFTVWKKYYNIPCPIAVYVHLYITVYTVNNKMYWRNEKSADNTIFFIFLKFFRIKIFVAKGNFCLLAVWSSDLMSQWTYDRVTLWPSSSVRVILRMTEWPRGTVILDRGITGIPRSSDHMTDWLTGFVSFGHDPKISMKWLPKRG